jgi:hypothetical protein
LAGSSCATPVSPDRYRGCPLSRKVCSQRASLFPAGRIASVRSAYSQAPAARSQRPRHLAHHPSCQSLLVDFRRRAVRRASLAAEQL